MTQPLDDKKDQPDGRCWECRWSCETGKFGVNCSVPQRLITNMTCLMKLQVTLLKNIDYELNYTGEDEQSA